MVYTKRLLRLATCFLAIAGVTAILGGQLSAAPKRKATRNATATGAPAAKKPAIDPAIIREVQNALTEQGFYFGVIDGELDAETQGALRRFQTYKGLGNSGMINEPTLAALRRASEEAAMEPRRGNSALSAAVRPAATPPAASAPRRSLPPPLKELENPLAARPQPGATPPSHAASAAVRPSTPPPRQQQSQPLESRAQPAPGPYHAFLRGTPYAAMPLSAQQGAIRHLQAVLARERFYHGPMDGAPTAATEEALYRLQSAYGLALSGRLDAPTLQILGHLSPHRPSASMVRGRQKAARPQEPLPPAPSQAAQAAQEPRTLGPAGKMIIPRSSRRPPQER